MKKLILLLLTALFIVSCSSTSGRVCGGRGGARCVEKMPKKDILLTVKENS